MIIILCKTLIWHIDVLHFSSYMNRTFAFLYCWLIVLSSVFGISAYPRKIEIVVDGQEKLFIYMVTSTTNVQRLKMDILLFKMNSSNGVMHN